MLSSFFGRLDLAVKHPHSLGHASVGGRCTQQSTIVSKRAEKRTIKSKLWISFLVYNFLPGLSPPKKLYGSSLSVLSLIKSPPLHLLSRPRLFLVDCCVVFIVRGSLPSDILQPPIVSPFLISFATSHTARVCPAIQRTTNDDDDRDVVTIVIAGHRRRCRRIVVVVASVGMASSCRPPTGGRS
jgi:hypothetical protein